MSTISEKKVDSGMNKEKKGRNKPSRKEALFAKKVEITIVQCPYCQSWKTSKLGYNISVFKGKRKRFKCNDCGHSFYLSTNAKFYDHSNTPEVRNKIRGCSP
jgi:transposase-like protein